jgi:hypothetical protein
MEAVAAAPAPADALCVHLQCGARMEIADGRQAQVAAALLRALAREGLEC